MPGLRVQGGWSEEAGFVGPLGADPEREVEFLAVADLGQTEVDGSLEIDAIAPMSGLTIDRMQRELLGRNSSFLVGAGRGWQRACWCAVPGHVWEDTAGEWVGAVPAGRLGWVGLRACMLEAPWKMGMPAKTQQRSAATRQLHRLVRAARPPGPASQHLVESTHSPWALP